MPSSKINGKKQIKEWVEGKNIETIVDVGAGSGTYPRLLGDKYKYIAIEIWEPYIEMFNLKKYYKEIIIGDVRKAILPKADCIIFGDVLEHLPKNDALFLLGKAYAFYNHLVLSIPVEGQSGSVHYNNPFEEHKSYWSYREIKDLTKWDLTLKSGGIGVFCK